ncbi:MAG: DUF721 domain-containing protein [Planctomycetota bacterium]|nr:DUF721 domain-containing protein [Planctomycetota bacterium]
MRKFNKNRIADIQIIRTLWKDSVGAEVAGESKVVSFSRGILTIDVFSSALIQELRQFHYESVVKDLRDNWQAATPLLRIKFQPGKRHGG